ncbi:hypothetical protein ILFOPFJJ_01816 [Ensifer psoraleae]|nr:hypothetical protein [Sinorhizobium psoraleae]
MKDLCYSGSYAALTDVLRDVRPPSEHGFDRIVRRHATAMDEKTSARSGPFL